MKKTLILFFSIALGSTAFAQQKTIEVNPSSGNSKKAIQKIELSADQKEKLTKINRLFNKQREAIETDKTLSAVEMKEKIKALQVEKQKKMRAVLTDQQWIEFENKRDAKIQNR
jgi:methionine-rich copper-binding protein CopC